MITTTHLTARYAETDQMQVIHHAVYPVWYEVAARNLSERQVCHIRKWKSRGL